MHKNKTNVVLIFSLFIVVEVPVSEMCARVKGTLCFLQALPCPSVILHDIYLFATQFVATSWSSVQ